MLLSNIDLYMMVGWVERLDYNYRGEIGSVIISSQSVNILLLETMCVNITAPGLL